MGQYESLTEKDKKIIIVVWKQIKTDLPGYGTGLFNTIFSDYPLMANFFPFSGPDDEKFEMHARIFMLEVDKWVTQLDKPQELKKMLEKLGASHSIRNIDNDQYVQMRESFIKTVRRRLGKRHFSEEEAQVFNKALTFAMNDIIESSGKDRVKRGLRNN